MTASADRPDDPVRPEPAEGRRLPSLEDLRTWAAALELSIPDDDLERLRPEIAALWRAAARLRASIPFDAPFLLGYDDPR